MQSSIDTNSNNVSNGSGRKRTRQTRSMSRIRAAAGILFLCSALILIVSVKTISSSISCQIIGDVSSSDRTIDTLTVATYRADERRQQKQQLKHEQERQYELLVLVIAADYGDDQKYKRPYKFFRNIWADVARRVEQDLELPIKTYLLDMSPNVTSITVSGARNEIITVPSHKADMSDLYIPGILSMTLGAMQYVRDARLPGYKHSRVLRTNLSSMWRFDKYLAYLNSKENDIPLTGLYHGFPQVEGDLKYVNGASILLSHDVETLLLARRDEINTTFIDDFAIGKFMRDHNIPVREGKFYTKYIHRQEDLEKGVLEPTEDHYHVRLKEQFAQRPGREQDVLLMSYLFFRYYGIHEEIGTVAPTPTPLNVADAKALSQRFVIGKTGKTKVGGVDTELMKKVTHAAKAGMLEIGAK